MDSIRYSRGKLAGMAAVLLLVAAAFMLIFLDPDTHRSGSVGLLTNGWTGHFIFVPVIELALLLIAWRIGYIATGSLDAVVVGPSGVRVTALWSAADIPWCDLILPRLIVRRTRYGKRYHICFDRRTGRSLRISASLTTLAGPDAYQDAIDAITQLQYDATRQKSAGTAVVAAALDSVAPPPLARGFGRKGVLG